MSPRVRTGAALLVGALSAGLAQIGDYLLVPRAAERGSNVVFALTTLAATAVIGAAFVVSLVALYRTEPGRDADRFLTALAVALNGFFLLVVVLGYAVPALIVHPTD